MDKLKELWSNWRGSIGFVGGALVVSTTFFTCTVDPNEEAIKEEILSSPSEESAEEPKEEPKEKEEPVEEETTAPSVSE